MKSAVQLQPVGSRRKRYKVRLRATIFFESLNGEQSVVGQGYDASEGGMALFAPVEFEIGTNLRINLTMPISGETLTFEAVVRNRDSFPGAYGIAFTSSFAEQKKLLTRYCAAMALLVEAHIL